MSPVRTTSGWFRSENTVGLSWRSLLNVDTLDSRTMGDLDLQHVTDEVVCVRRRSYQTCSYLIRRPDGVVLVDAGMRSKAEDVAAALRFVNSDFSQRQTLERTDSRPRFTRVRY